MQHNAVKTAAPRSALPAWRTRGAVAYPYPCSIASYAALDQPEDGVCRMAMGRVHVEAWLQRPPLCSQAWYCSDLFPTSLFHAFISQGLVV